MPPKMTHICLHVENLQQCAAFYERYCGLSVVKDRTEGGEGSIYMKEQNQEYGIVFQLMSGGSKQHLSTSDNRHFGFVVDSRDTVDEIAENAHAEECLIWEPGEYIPGAYLCTVKDPNGNFVEFSFGHPMPPP